MGRIGIPLGAAQSARRIKRHALGPAAGSFYGIDNRITGAVMTGVLTFASFYYLFGLRLAAILLALIFVHEAGHAIAMRWVGLPVQGIYFIPFLGGVAVSGAPHRSEAERGFVALMGPGLSIVTTAIFFALWKNTEQPVYAELALVSAFLNGMNLAPVLPLDGGHVTASLLSRSDPEFSALMNFTALLAGVAIAVYLEWHILLALLAINTMFAFRSAQPANSRPGITRAGMVWLATGYVATVIFYVAIVLELTR
jgi:Zn-dependent protease